MEFDAFLCHRKIHAEQARRIYEHLTKEGLRVWFDEVDLSPHGNSDQEMRRGISASRFLVFLAGPGEGETGPRDGELEEARRQSKGIVVVTFDGANPPLAAGNRVAVTLDRGWEQGVAALVRQLRLPAVTRNLAQATLEELARELQTLCATPEPPGRVRDDLLRAHAEHSLLATLDQLRTSLPAFGPRIDEARRRIESLDPDSLRPPTPHEREEFALAAGAATRRFLDATPEASDLGLPRSTLVEELGERLRQDRVVWLTGGPGTGKSHLTRELITRVQREGRLVLAFRIDRGFEHPSAGLACALQLPAQPRYGLHLWEREHGRRPLLVIDQLDATSDHSGNRPELFPTVRDLLHELRTEVLLVCRSADLAADSRMQGLRRAVGGVEVEVPRLTEAEVGAVLARLGVTREALGPLGDLLHDPLGLSVLRAVWKPGHPPRTRDALFDRYLDLCVETTAARGHSTETVIGAIGELCRAMEASFRASVPRATLPPLETHLLASGLLVRDAHDLAFRHQTLFDAAWCRYVLGPDRPLLDWLAESPQDLRQRPQLRRAILDRHGRDPIALGTEVRTLLRSRTVRPHLQQVVARTLGELDTPSVSQQLAVEALLDAGDDWSLTLFRIVLLGHRDWLRAAERLGWWEHHATKTPGMREWALRRVARSATADPDLAGRTLQRALDDRRWDEAARLVGGAWAPLAGAWGAAVEVAGHRLPERVLPRDGAWVRVGKGGGEEAAVRLIRLVASALRRTGADGLDTALGRVLHDPRALEEAARIAPVTLLDHLMPATEHLVTAARGAAGRDALWRHPRWAPAHEAVATLVSVIDRCLRDAQRTHPHVGWGHLRAVGRANGLTARRWALHGWAARVAAHRGDADAALEWFLSTRSLDVPGLRSASIELLTQATPHAGTASRSAVCRALRRLAREEPDAEVLLVLRAAAPALDPELAARLRALEPPAPTAPAQRRTWAQRYQAWARKEGDRGDEAWLRLIEAHIPDGPAADKRREMVRTHLIAAPDRFLPLLLRLSPDVRTEILRDALLALQNVAPDRLAGCHSTLVTLTDGALDHPDTRFGAQVVLGRFTRVAWPEAVLQKLVAPVFEAPRSSSRHDIDDAIVNDPGAHALEAAGYLLAAEPGRIGVFGPAFERAVEHPDPVLRAAAGLGAHALLSPAGDVETARRWFARTVQHPHDEVLASHLNAGAIRAFARAHPDLVRPLMDRMVRSPVDTVARWAGIHVALAAFHRGWADALELVEWGLGHPNAQVRGGIAEVLAHNVERAMEDPVLQTRWPVWLRQTWDDPDPNVRRQSGRWYRGVPEPRSDLLASFVHSIAASEEGDALHDVLLSRFADRPELSGALVDRTITRIREGEGPGWRPPVHTLVVRSLEASRPEVRAPWLDRLDTLARLDLDLLVDALRHQDA